MPSLKPANIPKKKNNSRLWFQIFISAVMLLAFLVRLIGIGSSLDEKEANLLKLSQQPFEQIMQHINQSSPDSFLTPLLIGFWQNLVNSDFMLRLPFFFLSLLTVFMAWKAAEKIAGEKAALITGFLFAINPLFVFYANQISSAALAIFFVVCSSWMATKSLQTSSLKSTWAFALLSLLATLANVFALLPCLMLGAWLLYKQRDHAKRIPAFAVGFLPGAFLCINSGLWYAKQDPLPNLLKRIDDIPTQFFSGPWSVAPILFSIIGFLACVLLIGYGIQNSKQTTHFLGMQLNISASGSLLLVFGIAGLIALFALGFWRENIFVIENALPSLSLLLLGISILATLCLQKPNNLEGIITLTAFFALSMIFALTTIAPLSDKRYAKTDFAFAAQKIKPGDLVWTRPRSIAPIVEHYKSLRKAHSRERIKKIVVIQKESQSIPANPKGFLLKEQTALPGAEVLVYETSKPREVSLGSLQEKQSSAQKGSFYMTH